jgi:hypothetical protein
VKIKELEEINNLEKTKEGSGNCTLINKED